MGRTFRQPGPQRQDRLGPVQSLDLRSLIHAHHDRVLRRVEVQARDIDELGFQLRVSGELEALLPPRPQIPLMPGLDDAGGGDTQLTGQQPVQRLIRPDSGPARVWSAASGSRRMPITAGVAPSP